MSNPLPRPPSIHPITGKDFLIEDAWQRWFNEIYNIIGATLVSAPSSSQYIIQVADALLSNAQVLASLNTGFVKSTHLTGVLSTQPLILNSDLSLSGVTAGMYGDNTHISQVTVNAQGIVTSASSVAIAGAPPVGTAGGGLMGSYPAPSLNPGQVIGYGIYAYTFAGGV